MEMSDGCLDELCQHSGRTDAKADPGFLDRRHDAGRPGQQIRNSRTGLQIRGDPASAEGGHGGRHLHPLCQL